MKQKDHKALAYYLLDSAGESRVWNGTWHRRFFIWGCIGPDYIPFTYLRGIRQSRAMLGHNAKYSRAHINKSILRLQRRGVRGFWDCFALGTLMHYLADSFTFVHTEQFLGNMKEHRSYERALHACFSDFLKEGVQRQTYGIGASEALHIFLDRRRRAYEAGEGSCEHDCRQIVHACAGVFQTLCCMPK